MKWLTLFAVLSLAGCGGGSPSSSPPGPTPTATSITVSAATAQVVSGQTKQFGATVVGTGNVSQSVTWSVAGNGTISSSGLFTAGNVGTATVMVASVENPSIINNASVTVSAATANLGKWSGAITTADGTQSTPLDFNLAVTGTALSTTGSAISTSYGPLAIWDNRTQTSLPNCSNLELQQTPSTNSVSGNMNNPGGISLSGSEIGTGLNPGDVSLAWQTGATASQVETLSLTCQFSPNDITLSGSYTNNGFLAGCFPSNTSGTFTFTKHTPLNETASGTFTYGTLGQIPISMVFNEDAIYGNLQPASITIGAIPGICASATTVNLIGHTDGKFFFMNSENFTQSSLEVRGIMNDPAGQTITIYTVLEGGTQDSPCVANPVTTGVIEGITLTKQ